MQSSNPALATDPFNQVSYGSSTDRMTIRGTVMKTAFLLLLVLLPASWIWKQLYTGGSAATHLQAWMYGGLFAGFILSLVTIFKKEWSAVTTPLYAVAEGLFLGGISGIFEQMYPGIVTQAVSLSIGTLIVMLTIYQAGWIQVTDKFKMGIVAATGGIALVYLVAIVLGFFGVQVPFIAENGWFSILFSLFVVGVAALNFILDFDLIEQGAKRGAPKYMEWYGAFALMITLIWLYIEILRLLSKINSKNN